MKSQLHDPKAPTRVVVEKASCLCVRCAACECTHALRVQLCVLALLLNWGTLVSAAPLRTQPINVVFRTPHTHEIHMRLRCYVAAAMLLMQVREKLEAAEERWAHPQFVGPNPEEGERVLALVCWRVCVAGLALDPPARYSPSPPTPPPGTEGNSEKKRHMKTSGHHITGGFRADHTPDVAQR